MSETYARCPCKSSRDEQCEMEQGHSGNHFVSVNSHGDYVKWGDGQADIASALPDLGDGERTIDPRTLGVLMEMIGYCERHGWHPPALDLVRSLAASLPDLLQAQAQLASRDARIATLEAELAKIQRAVGNVCLAFHDWPEYTGSEYCRAERKNAINDLAEAAAPTAPSEPVNG